jgi:hypothetical protein
MQFPENVVQCIHLYNNVFKDDINWGCDQNVNNLFYIKVLLIEKILQISDEYLDINFSSTLDVSAFLPNIIPTYINDVSQLIINNRTAAFHRKASKRFTIDLMCDAKSKLSEYGLVVNVVLCWIYDLSTSEI